MIQWSTRRVFGALFGILTAFEPTHLAICGNKSILIWALCLVPATTLSHRRCFVKQGRVRAACEPLRAADREQATRVARAARAAASSRRGHGVVDAEMEQAAGVTVSDVRVAT